MKKVLVLVLLIVGSVAFSDEANNGQCDTPMINEWLSNMGYVDDNGMPSEEIYLQELLKLAQDN